MKRTMCGRGGEETALSTIPSGPPSAKERSQNSLESVALSYALGGTESGGDVHNGFQMSGCSCLLSRERQEALGSRERGADGQAWWFRQTSIHFACVILTAFQKARLALCVRTKSLQSCLTLCDPTDCSPPGSSVHGILQARILEWGAMPFSRGSS